MWIIKFESGAMVVMVVLVPSTTINFGTVSVLLCSEALGTSSSRVVMTRGKAECLHFSVKAIMQICCNDNLVPMVL